MAELLDAISPLIPFGALLKEGLGALAVIILSVYEYRLNGNLTETITREWELSEGRRRQYEFLQATMENIRRYRHDMINHFICIQSLIEEGKVSETSSYVEELLGIFTNGRKGHYHTGADILDALTDFQASKLGGTSKVVVEGCLYNTGAVPDIDLCSIYGNLLSNAAEALTESASESGRIRVRLKNNSRFFMISVENPCCKANRYAKDGLPITKKPDPRNHGIGLRNVKECVRRNGGTFSIREGRGVFAARVCLPIRGKH